MPSLIESYKMKWAVSIYGCLKSVVIPEWKILESLRTLNYVTTKLTLCIETSSTKYTEPF